MLAISRKQSDKNIARPTKPKLFSQLRQPLKWRDESQDLNSHCDSDTEPSRNTAIWGPNRSVSPTEYFPQPFSLQNQLEALRPQQNLAQGALGSHVRNSKYKTELCKNYELYGYCGWAENCFFAHGRSELKEKTLTCGFYKTKVCKNFHRTGFCPYAARCQYFHFKSCGAYKELTSSFENKVSSRITEANGPLAEVLSRSERLQPRLKVFKHIVEHDSERALLDKFLDDEI